RDAGGTPMEFNTIAISDGITMGTSGMKTSLVSRELMAVSIELASRGYLFDAVVAISGCDKTIPGTVMALARLDVPSLMPSGGSTNAVLHLLAVAREAGVDLDIDDFDRIASRTPLVCDLKPGGQYVAVDLFKAGGVGVVAQRLLDAGLLHDDAPTVTGRTIGEHARETQEAEGQRVVRPLDDPLKPAGGLAILRGNLAPEGCVV